MASRSLQETNHQEGVVRSSSIFEPPPTENYVPSKPLTADFQSSCDNDGSAVSLLPESSTAPPVQDSHPIGAAQENLPTQENQPSPRSYTDTLHSQNPKQPRELSGLSHKAAVQIAIQKSEEVVTLKKKVNVLAEENAVLVEENAILKYDLTHAEHQVAEIQDEKKQLKNINMELADFIEENHITRGDANDSLSDACHPKHRDFDT